MLSTMFVKVTQSGTNTVNLGVLQGFTRKLDKMTRPPRRMRRNTTGFTVFSMSEDGDLVRKLNGIAA